MKKILAMLMTFILIMGLAGCGSDGSEAGELTKAASEIKLPEAIDYITDMKVDENGCITLAAYERKGDFNGIISISKLRMTESRGRLCTNEKSRLKKEKITLLKHISTWEIREATLK